MNHCKDMAPIRSQLFDVYKSGNIEVFNFLLDLPGVDIESIFEYGCGHGCLKLVKLLWERHIISNDIIWKGMENSVYGGYPHVLKFLLLKSNISQKNIKVLLEQCQIYSEEVLDLLVDCITNTNERKRVKIYNLAIACCCKQGFINTVKKIMDHKDLRLGPLEAVE